MPRKKKDQNTILEQAKVSPTSSKNSNSRNVSRTQSLNQHHVGLTQGLARQNSHQYVQTMFRLDNKEIKNKLTGNNKKELLHKFLADFLIRKNKYLYNWNLLFKKKDQGLLNKSIRQRKCIVNLGKFKR